MYNSDIPSRAELPTTAQLIKSTIFALVSAALILVTIVLPAEYAIDPTGVGRMLRLTEMGEIKQQLAAEAEADRIKDEELLRQQQSPGRQSGLLSILTSLLITPAHAQARDTGAKTDEITITLKPTEGVEWKMSMRSGAKVEYEWSVASGVVNYDMHGTPVGGGKETSYKAQRGVKGDTGVLTAGFDGTHGWFFRNRGREPVIITLKTNGAYTELKRVQ